MPDLPPFELVQAPEFSRSLDEAGVSSEFVMRMERGIMWAVRNGLAEAGKVPGYEEVRFVRVTDFSTRRFIVLFRVDGHVITLLRLFSYE